MKYVQILLEQDQFTWEATLSILRLVFVFYITRLKYYKPVKNKI